MTEFVGIISDTHGLIRPEALKALDGASLIIHAGDIGSPVILDTLKSLAPVIAIRGNVDKQDWAVSIPETEAFETLGKYFYVLHSLKDLDLAPAGQFDAVISGHSHKPECFTKEGVLYLNPGSAGPRRFKLPVSVAKVSISDDRLMGEIVMLDV